MRSFRASIRPGMGVGTLSYGLKATVLALSMTIASQAFAVPYMDLDREQWQLIVLHDFRNGDRPDLYKKWCAPFGSDAATQTARSTNFTPENVYWQNGALVFKFESRRNQSCTGTWAKRAGGGVRFTTPGFRSIAAEFHVAGVPSRGSQAYLTTWPYPDQPKTCGWGAEDDFYEHIGSSVWASTHSWNSACQRRVIQSWYNISSYTNFHKYGVMRVANSSNTNLARTSSGCISFYVDGQIQKTTCDENFRPYMMWIGGGIGGQRGDLADTAKGPAYMRIQKIKIWKAR